MFYIEKIAMQDNPLMLHINQSEKAYESDETMIVLLAVVGILMSACQLKCLPGFRKLHDEILKRRESGKMRIFFSSSRRELYVFVQCPYMTTCSFIYICMLTSFRFGQLHKQLFN